MFATTITMKPPYSFERLLQRLLTHPDEQLQIDAAAGVIRRALRLDGQPVLVVFRFGGSVEEPVLQIETEAALTQRQQDELIRVSRHMYGVDVDLEPVYRRMRESAELRPLTEKFRGLRLLHDPDLFQSMVRTIIGQQLNLAFAATLTHRLIRQAGDVIVDQQGREFLVFPTPEAVARLEVEQMRAWQFSQRKAEYIIDFARAVVSGDVDLDRLHAMPDEDVIACLSKLRGIGRWTVECLLMFGMGRPDLLPAADIGLRNGIQLVYGIAEKPDEQEIRRIGESWAPYRSYVSLYLWEAVGEAKREAAREKAESKPRRK
ncbi:DNA-3-methyladenine glycosylase family protein [Brevibacillus fluminis]|uniref:DNA-3-methyladenine glycosylase family protein n=1 Tax=Brevibacillus fluminis TaxID=511487 RepID=UPI003F8C962C